MKNNFILLLVIFLIVPISIVKAKSYTLKEYKITFDISDGWQLVTKNEMKKYNFDVINSIMNNSKTNFVIIPNKLPLSELYDNSEYILITQMTEGTEIFKNDTVEEMAEKMVNLKNYDYEIYKNNEATYIYLRRTKETSGITNDMYITNYKGSIYRITYVYFKEKSVGDKELRDFIDKIQFSKTTNNEQISKTDKQLNSENNQTTNITIDDGKGNIIREKITFGSNNAQFKNFMIKLLGTIICVVLAIVISKGRKLKGKGIFAWLLIFFQVIDLFFNDSLLVTSNKVEVLYVLVYFLSGILGLILLSRTEFKTSVNIYKSNNNNTKINKDESSKIEIIDIDI